MEKRSRTEYSAKNTTVAMISKMIVLIMAYLTRIVFIKTLNEDYVGVNGLFTNILNGFSASTFGLSTAIVYALYRPVAQGDQEKIKSLLQLYKRLYRVVSLIVTGLGVMIIPFFDVIMKNTPQVEHLVLVYLLYLSNSVVSFFMVYKWTLLDANQLSYIGTLYQAVFFVAQYVLQMLVLAMTHNIIFYLCIYIACTLLCNMCVSWRAGRIYPFIKERNVAPLPAEEKKDIWKNVRAMLMHKVGDVMVNNTDNLIISMFVGTMAVGRYSNYFLIIGSVRQVFDQAFRGITASVGNLNVLESKHRVQKIFESTCFVGQWFYGFAAVCLFEMLDPFVELSFGAKFVFTRDIVLILCINFFVRGMCMSTMVFRDSLGLFWADRYKSVAEALINVVASVFLVIHIGVPGVFIGTFISTILTTFWIEPWVLYRYLGSSPAGYFGRFGIYSIYWCIIWIVTDWACAKVQGNLLQILFLRMCICLVVPNVMLWLRYHKTKEFQFLYQKIRTGFRKAGV